MSIDWLASTQVANNLGGTGPGPDPTNCQCLRYQSIGHHLGASIDLVVRVAPGSTYQATGDPTANRKLPRLGQITMRQGTYTDFEITFEYTPPSAGRRLQQGSPIFFQNTYLTVMDLEAFGGERREYIYLRDATEIFLTPGTQIVRGPPSISPADGYNEMFYGRRVVGTWNDPE